MADRLSSSRFGRAAKLGGLAAGAAGRTLTGKAGTVGRSEEAKAEANRKAVLETAERMVTVLGSMRGAAMKIGQTLSVIDLGLADEELSEEFQAKLAKLQTMAPTVAFKDMRKVIEDDLGERIDDLFSEFGEEPIAAASIGQVYRARLQSGRVVAVKVQYPGIKQIVRSDLKNLGLVLKAGSRMVPGLATKEVAEEITERIVEELDYELEADNQRALAREYRGHPFITVPEVVSAMSTERVLVSEFVPARRFADVTGEPDEVRNRLGEILFRFYVNGPFRHRLLSGDPHPGNSLFPDDGRVAFLDFGFFKHQSAAQVKIQREVLKAVYAQDPDRLFEISREQGVIGDDRALVEPLMEKYTAATWWFMEDREVTLTPADVTRIVWEHADMRKGFGDVGLPAEQLTTLRAFGLTLGILAQLRATNNWFRIGREVVFGDEPATELGRAEAAWLTGR